MPHPELLAVPAGWRQLRDRPLRVLTGIVDLTPGGPLLPLPEGARDDGVGDIGPVPTCGGHSTGSEHPCRGREGCQPRGKDGASRSRAKRPRSKTLLSPPTRVSPGVDGRPEEQHVLGEGGVQQAHGAHPAARVHEHPLQVLVGQDVARVLLPQLHDDLGERQLMVQPCGSRSDGLDPI